MSEITAAGYQGAQPPEVGGGVEGLALAYERAVRLEALRNA